MASPGFISYSVKADKAFQGVLERAFRAVDDLRPAFNLIAKDFYRSEKAIFKLKTAGQYPDFQGPRIKDTWKDPGRPEARTRDGGKTAYQYYKLKKFGFEYPLLKATGALEDSVTGSSSPDSILIIDKKVLAIGTSLPYGIAHQEGLGNMPLRKFLFIGPESAFASNKEFSGRLQRWNNIINSYILRKLGATASEASG